MSKLAQIDAIQQELWDICEEEEEDSNTCTNYLVGSILDDLEVAYELLGLRAFEGNRGGYGFRMVLLCGINHDNLPESLRPT